MRKGFMILLCLMVMVSTSFGQLRAFQTSLAPLPTVYESVNDSTKVFQEISAVNNMAEAVHVAGGGLWYFPMQADSTLADPASDGAYIFYTRVLDISEYIGNDMGMLLEYYVEDQCTVKVDVYGSLRNPELYGGYASVTTRMTQIGSQVIEFISNGGEVAIDTLFQTVQADTSGDFNRYNYLINFPFILIKFTIETIHSGSWATSRVGDADVVDSPLAELRLFAPPREGIIPRESRPWYPKY